jgi:hypothetical protein
MHAATTDRLGRSPHKHRVQRDVSPDLNMKNSTKWITAVAAIAILLLAWLLLEEYDQNTALAAKLAVAQAEMKQAAKERPVRPAAFYVPPPPSASATVRYVEPSPEGMSSEESMRRSQTLQFTMQKVRQRNVQSKYAYLLEIFGDLGADKLAQLKQLLVDREAILSDTRAAAARQGVTPNSDTYKQALAETTKESEQNLRTLLGDKYDDFKRLDTLSGPMGMLDRTIGPDMAFGNAPLNNEQRLQMAMLMNELHYSPDDSLFPSLVTAPVNPGTGLSPLNEQLVAKASAILSPAQLEVLKAYQKEQSAFQAYRTHGPPP